MAEAVAGDVRAEGQGCEREDVADDLLLDLARAVAGDARDREDRIGRQALLDEIGFSQRQLVIGRLQALVVEQRDLHRRIDGERACEQAPYRRTRPLGTVGRADEGDILLDGLA